MKLRKSCDEMTLIWDRNLTLINLSCCNNNAVSNFIHVYYQIINKNVIFVACFFRDTMTSLKK